MSVSPLFVTDIDTLKGRLRLSGSVSSDSVAIIEDAVQKVRIGFYRALGASRITTLLALGEDDNPVTDDGILRATASVTEVMWVRRLLLRTMPVLLLGSQSSDQTAWNQDGLVREAGHGSVEAEINRLKKEIDENLQILAGEEDDTGDVLASTIGPDETPPLPFDSITDSTEWV